MSLHTLEHVTEEKRAELAGHLNHSLEMGKSYYCFEITLAFVRLNSPLAMVRECYNVLSDLVAWGYPFMRRLPEKKLETIYADWVVRLKKYLSRDELSDFSDEWVALMAQEKQKYEALLRYGGEEKHKE